MSKHNHREVMQSLAEKNGWENGIELGLGSGKLFARFLASGVQMIGVDMGFRLDRKAQVEKLIADPETMGNVLKVYWMTTDEAAALVPDKWADFVFIDAGHSYKAVQSDIRNWMPKVKDGGWFGGHDYHPKFPGVVRAVNEAFGTGGIELLDGHIWVKQ